MTIVFDVNDQRVWAFLASAALADSSASPQTALRTGGRINIPAGTFVELDAGISTIAASPQQMRVQSTSSSDTANGPGVCAVRLTYVNALGAPATEVITLNGTSPVNTLASDIHFVNYFQAETVGSSGFACGAVSLQDSTGTTTFARIEPDTNRWKSLRFHVPVGYTAVIYGWMVSASNGEVQFSLLSTQQPGFANPLIERTDMVVANNVVQASYTVPFRVPGPGRITVRARSSGITTPTAASSYVLLLHKNP